MRTSPWGKAGFIPDRQNRKTNYLLALLLIVSLLLFCAGLYIRYAPPGQGTICKKGCHQAVYDMYNHVDGNNVAYYLCIASDDGNTWWM